MKANMVAYACALSDNDYGTLERVVLDNYKSFIDAYWLLTGYNDLIETLEHMESDKGLTIKIIFKDGVDGDFILSRIEESLDEDSGVTIVEKTKKFVIKVTN